MTALPKRKGNRHFAVQLHALRQCLNESPSKKEGKYERGPGSSDHKEGLNESPSKKDGKCGELEKQVRIHPKASMKVPPKRKGNPCSSSTALTVLRLNESPSQKEGKCQFRAALAVAAREPQ